MDLEYRLAQFSIFGEDVLLACVPLGKVILACLASLWNGKLEEVPLDKFPSNVEFEELWEECVLSILCLLDTNIRRTYYFLVSIIKFSPAICIGYRMDAWEIIARQQNNYMRLSQVLFELL